MATFLLPFPDCPIERGFPFISYAEAAAEGGVSGMRLILDHDDFQVTRGSYAAQQALRKVLAISDTATLALLIERGHCAVSIDDKPILALVDSLDGDVAAMAATIDMLIAHGTSVENEDTSNSALYQSALSFEFGSLVTKMDLCRLLLDRGPDALRIGSKYPATPLAIASRVGNKELVEMMLRSLEGRIIPLEKLE